jgi:UDP-GlcNAc:undecaprenyl-phosphate GlcNAc-1-phosphate transferase
MYLLSRLFDLPAYLKWHDLFVPILLPATLIFLLGLYDDLWGVQPVPKFAVQTVAAVMVYFSGLKIGILPILFGNQGLGTVLSLLMTVFWILWITNAFNLVDGVDGLAAGSALFSSVAVFIASTLNQNWMGLVVTAMLSGTLLGFLRFNFNPATIFLGDSGSLLVGFILAAVALNGQKSPTIIAVAIPIISCGLPILETGFSILRRFLSGKPIFGADREHIHHKLLQRGLSQRQVALLLYGVSAVFGLLSLTLLLPGGGPVALVMVVLGGSVWVGLQYLGYHEFFELRRVAQRTIEQKQVIVNNLAIRRGMEQFAGCRTVDQFQSILMDIFSENDFDGVQIRYALKGSRHPSPRLDFQEFDFSWYRTGEASPSAWSLEIDFSGAFATGYISLHRRLSEKPLMVDINLLGKEFASTMDRTLRRLLLQDVDEVKDSVAAPSFQDEILVRNSL